MGSNPQSITDTVATLIKKYDLAQVVRYGVVGVFVASMHFIVALAAYKLLNFPQVVSNFCGFVAGAILSYLGSYYFTFRLTKGHKQSLPRFALVWAIGIAVNVGLFGILLAKFAIPFAINVFIAIVVTPIAQFLMLKFWAFK